MSHHLFRLFYGHIFPGPFVYLIGELGAVLNHLLHRHVLRELTIHVTIVAVIIITATIGICSFVIICKRHTAALTKFLFHILILFLFSQTFPNYLGNLGNYGRCRCHVITGISNKHGNRIFCALK